MEYDANCILFNKSAPIFPISTDKCKQAWNITFKQLISDEKKLRELSQSLSSNGFKVNLKLINPKHILATTIFEKYENIYGHDPSIVLQFKLFYEVEKELGEIDTIEGQKIEERWSPYKRHIETEDP